MYDLVNTLVDHAIGRIQCPSFIQTVSRAICLVHVKNIECNVIQTKRYH